MHQICWRLGLCHRLHWEAYSAPPDCLAGFKGPTFKSKEGEGKRTEGGGTKMPMPPGAIDLRVTTAFWQYMKKLFLGQY